MEEGSAEPPPKTHTEYIERLLVTALDCGIKEFDFWEMTIAEVVRAIESANRVAVAKARERASCDYILANLITRGVSLVLGSKQNFPTLEEAYPTLFTQEISQQKKIQEQKTNLSTLRFLQFAQSYNQRFKNKEVPEKINE